MRPHILVFCALVTCVRTSEAQVAQMAPTPQVAFDRFLRMAATVGQPAAALNPLFPTAPSAGAIPERYSITAAHTIVIGTRGRSGDRDSVPTVSIVTWRERVADTIALRRRVSETMQQIERIAGRVERCGDPLGPPAYLFAPQTVTRSWSRGVAERPTQLVWEVGPGADFSITVRVGQFADTGSATYSCDAKRE
ncbi:MAG: hypothetical protein U5K74_06110 [Gemmatimonadaceae bacterium]|nr:hypothetical protein [Gemmatimonadaceae bacterium]